MEVGSSCGGGGRSVTFSRVEEHVRNIRECLWTLYKERRMVDVNVFCHGHHFQAHKVVLAVSSPVFKSYFVTWRSNPISAIQISDRGLHLDYVAEHASDVAHLVEFVYTGRVKVSRDRLKPLLRLAEALLVKTLIDAIVRLRDAGGAASWDVNGCTILACADHLRMLGDGLWQLLQENYVVDTNVVCRELMVRAHKVVITAACPVLGSFLTQTSDWPQCGVVVTILGLHLDYIAEENADTMSLLEFLYRGQVTVPESRVHNVLNLASKLEVRRLVDEIMMSKQQSVKSQQKESSSSRGGSSKGSSMRGSVAEKKAAAAAEHLVTPSTSSAIYQYPGGETTHLNSISSWSGSMHVGKSGMEAMRASNVALDGGYKGGGGGGVDVNGIKPDHHHQSAWNYASAGLSQRSYLQHQHKYLHSSDGWRKNEVFEGNLDFRNGQPLSSFSASTSHSGSTSGAAPAPTPPHHQGNLHQEATTPTCAGSSDSSSQSRNEYICGICKEILQDNDSYDRHMSTHRNPNQCPLCPFYSSQKGRLTQHLAAIHRIDERGNQLPDASRCTLCDYSCSAPHKLTQHYMKKHCKDKPYRCSLCDYATVVEQELEKHVRQRHPDRQRHECAVCGFLARTKTGLTLHARSHDRGKIHKCHVCKDSFAAKDKLEMHMLSHAAPVASFPCHVCSMACPTEEGLRLHLSRAHGYPMLNNANPNSDDIVRIINNEQITELRVL